MRSGLVVRSEAGEAAEDIACPFGSFDPIKSDARLFQVLADGELRRPEHRRLGIEPDADAAGSERKRPLGQLAREGAAGVEACPAGGVAPPEPSHAA